MVALRQTSSRFALHPIGTLQERYWILAAYLGLGDIGTEASFQQFNIQSTDMARKSSFRFAGHWGVDCWV
jgi:hypothetical protein